MKRGFKLSISAPKTRKPVAKKPNTVMKSKKDYRRRPKHGKLRSTISEE